MALTSTRPSVGTTPSEVGPEPVNPAWVRPTLLALLAATLALYTWNLTASGWANSFYTAAAQAGSESWKAFFYGSFDAANAITVDKPPASLWVMGLSVRLLGLSSFAILVPQALMGVATVGVVFATVRRHFGPAAGLLAGAVVALTPVAALMFRFNNPDALLTLLMALGAWAMMRAVEAASARWMVLVGVFIGLGFLTKTLQVLLVVPFLGLAYLVAAPTSLRRRIVHSLIGLGAAVLSAGWWVAIVELVPASARPYIGGSQTNSFLELTFGYNGLGRLSGEEAGSVGGGNGWGATGLARMFGGGVGGQVSWLIPSALILLAVGLFLRGRRPRTDLRRAAYLVWGGWLVVTMLVFSLMAGIFHEYYTVALAPAIGALVGMGAAEVWERRGSWVGTTALAPGDSDGSGLGFRAAFADQRLWRLAAVRCAGGRPARGVRAARVEGSAGQGAHRSRDGWGRRDAGWTGCLLVHDGVGGAHRLDRHGRPGGRHPGGWAGGLWWSARPPRARRAGARRATVWPWRWLRAVSARWPRRGWRSARRIHAQHGGGRDAVGERSVVHLGRGQRGLAERSRPPDRDTAAGHGGRRIQRLGPESDAGAVPAVRRRRPDPLLRWRWTGLRRMAQMGGSSASSEIAAWVQENFQSVTIDGTTFYDLTQPANGQVVADPGVAT